jgi:hypothetical protein
MRSWDPSNSLAHFRGWEILRGLATMKKQQGGFVTAEVKLSLFTRFNVAWRDFGAVRSRHAVAIQRSV